MRDDKKEGKNFIKEEKDKKPGISFFFLMMPEKLEMLKRETFIFLGQTKRNAK